MCRVGLLQTLRRFSYGQQQVIDSEYLVGWLRYGTIHEAGNKATVFDQTGGTATTDGPVSNIGGRIVELLKILSERVAENLLDWLNRNRGGYRTQIPRSFGFKWGRQETRRTE